jgi:hypothetical protein
MNTSARTMIDLPMPHFLFRCCAAQADSRVALFSQLLNGHWPPVALSVFLEGVQALGVMLKGADGGHSRQILSENQPVRISNPMCFLGVHAMLGQSSKLEAIVWYLSTAVSTVTPAVRFSWPAVS